MAYVIENAKFKSDNLTSKTIFVFDEEKDDAFSSMQEASIGQYKNHNNKQQEISDNIRVSYILLKDLINNHILTLNDDVSILDVGCGISNTIPAYMPTSSIKSYLYIGLDPYLINTDRDYLFICSKIENLNPSILFHRFNLFVFSTTLDHMRNLDETFRSIKDLADEDGYAIFLVGIHDTRDFIKYRISLLIDSLFEMKNKIILPLFLVIGVLKIIFRSLLRQYKISNNLPLDNLHFHYFTRNKIRLSLQSLGTIENYFNVPNSNSVLFKVKISV